MQGMDLRDKFIKRSRYTQARISDLMNDVNKNVYMCDPDQFILGGIYYCQKKLSDNTKNK